MTPILIMCVNTGKLLKSFFSGLEIRCPKIDLHPLSSTDLDMR